MKLSAAVALRVNKILREKELSQYRLEKNIAMPHNTLKTLMRSKNQGVHLKTVLQIVRGLGITPSEFFDDPIFQSPDLEIE